MPENYTALFPVPGEQEAERMSLREQSLSFNMVLTGSPRIGTSPNVK